MELNLGAYAEAFGGKFLRFYITADNIDMLKYAATQTTALPCTVLGRPEGGIESIFNGDFTPDGRPGAIVQLWMNENTSPEDFEYEMSARIRQGTLVVPGTKIYDAMHPNAKVSEPGLFDTMESVGYCGDGFQETIEISNPDDTIKVPVMAGDFNISRFLTVGEGISGGNLWFYINDERPVQEVMSELWKNALSTVYKTEGVIAPFGICSAGSKVGSIMAEKLEGTPEGDAYKKIGPTTHHLYCPTIKDRVPESMVPEGIVSIPEIVIDGVDMKSVKRAMLNTIYAAQGIKGLVAVSAGDYGGELGKHNIYIKDLF
ncbi:MAG: formylmethanofuran--tetrahydromethanopterin formyltransferase [archaeon]|nr:formylmethanofuran--tetrahydromethanopterin formyltransferase [archaeon]